MVRHHRRNYAPNACVANCLVGIVSAPLWDSRTSTFAGLLTTSDYINVIQYYWQNPTKLSEIDGFTLNNLRGRHRKPHLVFTTDLRALDVERDIGARPPETVSIDPERPLYEACRKMLASRARRIPLISSDSQTGRTMVTSVITQYRILKFVAVNVADTQNLRKPLKDIKLGTYNHLVKCSMDAIVLDVIHWMVKHNISSVPIVTAEGEEYRPPRKYLTLTTAGILLNVFEAVDVIMLIKGGDYDSLQLTVGEALRKRPDDYPGIYTCSPEDGLDTIFETIRKSRVHRLMVIDNDNRLKGILSLSDILQYILLEGEHEDVANL
jgi:5'-AMP-activated protein kinase, regulatory gamma subunit